MHVCLAPLPSPTAAALALDGCPRSLFRRRPARPPRRARIPLLGPRRFGCLLLPPPSQWHGHRAGPWPALSLSWPGMNLFRKSERNLSGSDAGRDRMTVCRSATGLCCIALQGPRAQGPRVRRFGSRPQAHPQPATQSGSAPLCGESGPIARKACGRTVGKRPCCRVRPAVCGCGTPARVSPGKFD